MSECTNCHVISEKKTKSAVNNAVNKIILDRRSCEKFFIVLYCIVLCCIVFYCIVLYCMIWYGMVWYGMVWHGMAWHGMV